VAPAMGPAAPGGRLFARGSARGLGRAALGYRGARWPIP
jgi:hypothetical protein